jgi:hypothetical protein
MGRKCNYSFVQQNIKQINISFSDLDNNNLFQFNVFRTF